MVGFSSANRYIGLSIDSLQFIMHNDPMAKLLIIEDEDFIRDLYKRQFEKAGFQIDAFGKGQEGLASALKNPYDLLLLDIMLPDINGIEILKQVKQSEAAKNIPVVMLTNLGQDNVIKEGFKFGAVGYLIKAAYTPDQVVKEVTSILNQQKTVQSATSAVSTSSAPEPVNTDPTSVLAPASSPVAAPVQATPPASVAPTEPPTQTQS